MTRAGPGQPPRSLTERLREELWPEAEGSAKLTTYAIVDGARDARIYPAVLACGLPYRCLYTGQLPEELLETAPYLVQLPPDAPFTEALLRDGWGDSWGIFLLSPGTLEALRRHFRQFLRVQDEDGRRLIFRFYDPRVLRGYLPTCNAAELSLFFGPVQRYLLEDAEPGTLLGYRRQDGLSLERVALGPGKEIP